MSSLIVLLGWLLDALSLKTWSNTIFVRFAGPSDGDYPVHRAIWAMCREGRYEDARRLASSRWEWTKSLRVGRDFIHILLRLGETRRAIEIADQMASQDANNPWPRILAADLHRFFGKDEDRALSMYLDAVPASQAMLPDDRPLAIVCRRLTDVYRRRGDAANVNVWIDKFLSTCSSAAGGDGLTKLTEPAPLSGEASTVVKRIPVATGLLTEACSPVETVVKYAKRRVRPKDTVVLSSRAAAVMQGRVLMEGTVPISLWAQVMTKYLAWAHHMTNPLSAQGALEEAGTIRLFAAVLAGAVGKLFKVDRWFCKVAGPRVAAMNDTLGFVPPYDYYEVMAPSEPASLSRKISEALGDGIGATVAGNPEQATPIVILRPDRRTGSEVESPSEEVAEQAEIDSAASEPAVRLPFEGLAVGPYLKALAKSLAWTAAAASVAGESTVQYTKTVLSNPRTRGIVIASILVVALGVSGVAWLARPVPVDVPVPVLLYHDLTADPVSRNGMVVPAHEFRAQMALLKECGYQAITAPQLEAHLTGRGTLPDHPILITFDDGYESVYTLAYPILREFGLRATAFVVGTTVRTPNHLTFEQMREMSAAGVVEIGSHTYAGHGGSAAKPDIASWTEEQVMADLSTLAAVLRAERVPMAPAFAYPFGDPSPSLVSGVRKLGFTIAFTTENGMASRTLSLLNQRRVTMWPGGDGALFLRRIEPSFWLEDDEDHETGMDVAASR